MTRTWWKEAVIYQIYPRSFQDSDGDGVGDLRGIIRRLDYIKQLGVDVVWLSPIYKSPNDDNGYDISDYYDIMTEFGTMADFDELLAGLHARGIRLLMDLVVNHTSDEHIWFRQSRLAKDNPYRDYYFWQPEPPNNWQSFFGGPAWEQDPMTGEYYLHLFSRRQPDLNWENPRVRQEIYRMMRFWLDKGVDGFRMDVIPLISKRLDWPDADLSDFNRVVAEVYANGPRIHEFLQEMHREVMAHYDIMTVGEGVGIEPHQGNDYVGEERRELDMIFHFGHMLLDHGPGGRFDTVDFSLQQFKDIFTTWHEALGDRGWVNIYLDNHDYPRLVSRFGNDTEHRVESAKLLAMLLLTLRGTPCIYQGSEIGMTNLAFDDLDDYQDIGSVNTIRQYRAENKDLVELLRTLNRMSRDNVRTPMQWDASEHAGFTDGQPWIRVNANHTRINVADALAKPDSIFYFYRRLIDYRRDHPTLVYGDYEVVDGGDERLYAFRRWDGQGEFYVFLNFSDHPYLDPPLPANRKLSLEIGNYPEEERREHVLGPWEARLYRSDKL